MVGKVYLLESVACDFVSHWFIQRSTRICNVARKISFHGAFLSRASDMVRFLSESFGSKWDVFSWPQDEQQSFGWDIKPIPIYRSRTRFTSKNQIARIKIYPSLTLFSFTALLLPKKETSILMLPRKVEPHGWQKTNGRTCGCYIRVKWNRTNTVRPFCPRLVFEL